MITCTFSAPLWQLSLTHPTRCLLTLLSACTACRPWECCCTCCALAGCHLRGIASCRLSTLATTCHAQGTTGHSRYDKAKALYSIGQACWNDMGGWVRSFHGLRRERVVGIAISAQEGASCVVSLVLEKEGKGKRGCNVILLGHWPSQGLGAIGQGG